MKLFIRLSPCVAFVFEFSSCDKVLKRTEYVVKMRVVPPKYWAQKMLNKNENVPPKYWTRPIMREDKKKFE